MTAPFPGSPMWYNVYFMTSRGLRWHKFGQAETLEEAMELARTQWETSIDHNAHVSVRIERQYK